MAFVACQKSENCEVDGVSTEYRYYTELCNDGKDCTIVIDTIKTSHISICDCETYCDRLNRAFENTIDSYNELIKNAPKNEIPKLQAERDYLIATKPNCNCQ